MSFVRFLLTLHFTKTFDTTVMPTNHVKVVPPNWLRHKNRRKNQDF